MIVVAAYVLAVMACVALCAIPPSTRAISLYRASAALSVAALWALVVTR